MDYELLYSNIMEKLKLAGLVATPDYSKGEMDESNRAISEGRPVSKLPTRMTQARTHPGHSGEGASMEEKLENAKGIKPEEWDEKKHGKKLASAVFEQVMKGIGTVTDVDSLEDLVAKCVKETIKKNLSPKETKTDEKVQGTAKPEKLDDDAAGKMVDEKAKKMKGKKDTKKSAEEEPDTLKRVIKMPKNNPYLDHYDKFGDFAPQGARAAEIENAIATNKPLREDPKDDDAKKAFSDDDYDVADDRYHAERDNQLTGMSSAEFAMRYGGEKKDKKDKKNTQGTLFKGKKTGGMSDEALDWGKDDDEAAKNWEKAAKKYEKERSSRKGLTFKSFQDAQAWNNPDPDRYMVRPTTFAERREFGQRMHFIADEIPQKEPVGAFGNRIVKGAKYNPKKDTLLGKKELMPKDTVVHDVKNPTKHMEKQFDESGKNPATVLAHRFKGPKGESIVVPPHSHDGTYATPEKEQEELRKSSGKDINSGGGLQEPRGIYGGIYGKTYYDSYWGGRNDDGDEDEDDTANDKKSKYVKKGKLESGNYDAMTAWGSEKDRKENPEKYKRETHPKDEEIEDDIDRAAALKSFVGYVTVEVLKAMEASFGEDKISHREDKYLAKDGTPGVKPIKEETPASKRVRAAVLTGDVLKAEKRHGRSGNPVTSASSDWVASGRPTDNATGKPSIAPRSKDDESIRETFRRADDASTAAIAHNAELAGRDARAQRYLDKKRAVKSLVIGVVKAIFESQEFEDMPESLKAAKEVWVRGGPLGPRGYGRAYGDSPGVIEQQKDNRRNIQDDEKEGSGRTLDERSKKAQEYIDRKTKKVQKSLEYGAALKATLRQGRKSPPLTEASSKHLSEGGKVFSNSGKPAPSTEESTDPAKLRKHFEKEKAHDKEVYERDSRAYDYLDSKRKAIKAIVEEVLKGYNPDFDPDKD